MRGRSAGRSRGGLAGPGRSAGSLPPSLPWPRDSARGSAPPRSSPRIREPVFADAVLPRRATPGASRVRLRRLSGVRSGLTARRTRPRGPLRGVRRLSCARRLYPPRTDLARTRPASPRPSLPPTPAFACRAPRHGSRRQADCFVRESTEPCSAGPGPRLGRCGEVGAGVGARGASTPPPRCGMPRGGGAGRVKAPTDRRRRTARNGPRGARRARRRGADAAKPQPAETSRDGRSGGKARGKATEGSFVPWPGAANAGGTARRGCPRGWDREREEAKAGVTPPSRRAPRDRRAGAPARGPAFAAAPP